MKFGSSLVPRCSLVPTFGPSLVPRCSLVPTFGPSLVPRCSLVLTFGSSLVPRRSLVLMFRSHTYSTLYSHPPTHMHIHQGVVTPICTVLRPATGVKGSRGQRLFLPAVNGSRPNLQGQNLGQGQGSATSCYTKCRACAMQSYFLTGLQGRYHCESA